MNRRCFFLQSCSLFFLLQLLASGACAQMPALNPVRDTGKLSDPANPQQFTFVLAGDNRPANKGCKHQNPVPGKIFAAVQAKPSVAFVLWTGDTISGKNPDATELQRQYKEFRGLAAAAGVPVFNAPGNHELDNKKNRPDETMKQLYLKNMAKIDPDAPFKDACQGDVCTYGAFTYGNSRFIALDSENNLSSGKTGSDAPGGITPVQLQLLAEDLKQNADKAHIFIFMHHPVEPFGDGDGLANAKALQALLKGKNVSYVVSGHEHMYYNPLGPKNKVTEPPHINASSHGPYYLVSGGGGAPPKKNAEPGNFFHYLVFDVDGATITPNLVPVGSCVSCKDAVDCDPCTLSDEDEKKKGHQMCTSFN